MATFYYNAAVDNDWATLGNWCSNLQWRHWNRPNWEGWEVVEGKGGVVVRPRGLEDHIKINHYFVPKDLSMRMLALGELL